jgi:hypothetical protein
MESRVRFLRHPVRQMLAVFPLGLLGGSAPARQAACPRAA